MNYPQMGVQRMMNYNSFIDYITQLGYTSFNSNHPPEYDSYLFNRGVTAPICIYIKEIGSYNVWKMREEIRYEVKFTMWNDFFKYDLSEIKDITSLLVILDGIFSHSSISRPNLNSGSDIYFTNRKVMLRDINLSKLLKEGEDTWR